MGYGSASGSYDISGATQSNFYSPELSTDFLQLPQSLDELRNYFRFFYRTNPFVGRAIDLHTQLPLSKIRLTMPKAKDANLARMAYKFCTKWAERIGLLQRLQHIVHDFHLLGEAFVFCEDANPELPKEVTHTLQVLVAEDGDLREIEVEREDRDDRAAEWMKKNYKGWTSIRTLPPEQIQIQTFTFSNEPMIEFVPDAKTRAVLEAAQQGDPQAINVAKRMPKAIVDAVAEEANVPLNMDPDAGSFVYYMANKKTDYEPRGQSILERVLRAIVINDMIRQAQVQIASRHMTPIRLVWSPDMDEADVEALRAQIDYALTDPDFSIIANFQLTWEEMNSNGRLLELSGEYEIFLRQLYAGLGVTESLMTGESSYAGDRINLEVINIQYQLLRDNLQWFIDNHVLKPMCKRMGFVEEDEDGSLEVIYPRLSFTRIALRDTQEVFDALFNLYNKGSLPIDLILELFNLDPEEVHEKLKQDVGTIKDATFNELIRGMYNTLGQSFAENSDFSQKVADGLGVTYTPPAKDEGSRF